MSLISKYKKLGKDFLLLTIGNFSSKILVFLLVPLYTSYLSTQDYGTADLLVTTISLITPVLTLTISESVMRYALDKTTDKHNVFTIGMIITIVSIILILILSPLLLLFDSIKEYYFIFLFYYITYSLSGLIAQFIKGINSIKSYTISGVISTIVTITFNIIFLVVYNLHVVGYMLAMIFGSLSSIIYLVVKEKLYLSICNMKNFDINLAKQMIKYSIPLIPNNLAWWIVNSSDRYMLLFFFSSSVVGVYSVAYKIPTILTTFTALFSTSMRISSVENFKSEETNKFLNNTYNMYFHFVVLCGAGLIAITKIIAKVLFQKEFFIAWQTSPILLMAFIAYGLAEYLGVIYLADKKTSKIFITCIIGATTNIIFNLFLIPYFGSNGAAIATFLGYLAIWITRYIGCKKIIPISMNYMDVGISFVFLFIEIVLLYINDILAIIVFIIFVLYKLIYIMKYVLKKI